jgi:adenosylcobinamide-GDP ribazoletransferase
MSKIDKSKDDYFEKKISILRSIGGLVTFSTVLPINIHTPIEDMARLTWFWPFISGIIGLIGGIISYFICSILFIPPLISATVIYSFFLIFNGFHHLDGLIDFGDAMMAHGSYQKKLSIMRDSMVGTGGIATFFIVGIITISSLNTILSFNLFTALIIIEMSGKIGLVTCCISSRAGTDGTGRFFINFMNIPKYALSIALAIAISYLLNSYVGVFGVFGGILGGALVSFYSERNFKIATGDVLGASNEIGRMFSALAIVLSFIWI